MWQITEKHQQPSKKHQIFIHAHWSSILLATLALSLSIADLQSYIYVQCCPMAMWTCMCMYIYWFAVSVLILHIIIMQCLLSMMLQRLTVTCGVDWMWIPLKWLNDCTCHSCYVAGMSIYIIHKSKVCEYTSQHTWFGLTSEFWCIHISLYSCIHKAQSVIYTLLYRT